MSSKSPFLVGKHILFASALTLSVGTLFAVSAKAQGLGGLGGVLNNTLNGVQNTLNTTLPGGNTPGGQSQNGSSLISIPKVGNAVHNTVSGATGTVGNITGLNGLVSPTSFSGGTVNAATNTITQHGGKVTSTVDLIGDGLTQIAVDKNVVKGATKGNVSITAHQTEEIIGKTVNLRGITEAKSVNIGSNGKIILGGYGVTSKADLVVVPDETTINRTSEKLAKMRELMPAQTVAETTTKVTTPRVIKAEESLKAAFDDTDSSD